MSEDFFNAPSVAMKNIIETETDPSRFAERIREQLLKEALEQQSQSQQTAPPRFASTPMHQRPTQFRNSEVFYQVAIRGMSKQEIIADSREDFERQLEEAWRDGWRW